MLNVFPIQFLAPLAYLILRVILGIVFLRMAKFQLQKDESGSRSWLSGFFSSVVGIIFILGFYTQIAALLGILSAIASRFSYFKARGFSYLEPTAALLVGAISLSLFITGGGPFGFDLPI